MRAERDPKRPVGPKKAEVLVAANQRLTGSEHTSAQDRCRLGQNRSVRQDSQEGVMAGGQGHAPAVAAVGIEDLDAGAEHVGAGYRIAGPAAHCIGRVGAELARALSWSTPSGQVFTLRREDPQFGGAGVGHHDPAVAKPGGVPNIEEHLARVTLLGADGESDSIADSPAEPRARIRTRILDDHDPGAVAGLGVKDLRRVLIDVTSGRRSQDDRRQNGCQAGRARLDILQARPWIRVLPEVHDSPHFFARWDGVQAESVTSQVAWLGHGPLKASFW